MANSTEIFDAASRLPISERAALIRLLLLSLEDQPFDEDEDIEAAWRTEIDRRLERLEKGDAKLLDWDEAYERLQASLKGQVPNESSNSR